MALAQAIFKECWPRWQQYFAQKTRLRLGCVVLADLASCMSEMASEYLRADELDRWTEFLLKKRRSEWLGGRMAAKWATTGLMGETTPEWQSLAIRNEEDGRPYVATETQAVVPFISISHSGPMAAALAADLPCGIDIQESGERILRVKERFAAPEEEGILTASLPDDFSKTQRLTMLWAAKEAVRKAVRTSPLLGLLEIRLHAGHGGCGKPEDPLLLTFASGRAQAGCPAHIPVLCFFADNLAWAMACLPTPKE